MIKSAWTAYDILGYLLAYLSWILTGAASMAAILSVRNSLNLLWPVLGASRWSLRAVDQFSMLFLVLCWLSYMVLTEHYYRSSISVARDKRLREMLFHSSSEAPDNSVAEKWRAFSLLLRRFLIAATFPVALFALDYLMRGVILFLVRR